jgi:CheY-like chemotaxis protein
MIKPFVGGAMKRVLIVDDDKVSLIVARDMLEEAGYEVQTSTSALEANEYIYSPRRPDLILLDVVMPLLSGDRKIQFLKERESSKNIPVILISMKSREELEDIAHRSGADGFLTKPLDRDSLLSAITQHL